MIGALNMFIPVSISRHSATTIFKEEVEEWKRRGERFGSGKFLEQCFEYNLSGFCWCRSTVTSEHFISSSSAIILWWHINNKLIEMCLMFDQHPMPKRIIFISQSLIMIMCVNVVLCSVLIGSGCVYLCIQMKSVLLEIVEMKGNVLYNLISLLNGFPLSMISFYLCQNHK